MTRQNFDLHYKRPAAKAFAPFRFLSLVFALFLFAVCNQSAQDVFFRDVVRGGVTGGGYSPAATESGNGQIVISIPPNCTIKQAYLLAGRHGPEFDLTIEFADAEIELNASNQVSTNFDTSFGENSGVHAIDVSGLIDPKNGTYEIVIPQQESLSNRYADFYLWVCYERTDLKLTHVEILLNSYTFSNEPLDYILDITPPNCFDIGLGLMCGYICNAELDGANLYINDDFLGRIGGKDQQSGVCGGPAANFSYFDGILRGLLDDTPDAGMMGSDVLADLSTFLSPLSTSFKLTLNSKPDNALWAMFLNYGIPELDIVVSQGELPLCPGEKLTLSAVGDFEEFLWSTESQSPSIVIDKPGVYTVLGIGANGCSKTAEIDIRQRITSGGLKFADNPPTIDMNLCENQKEQTFNILNDSPESTNWGEAVSREPALLAVIQQPAQGRQIAANETVQITVRVQAANPGSFAPIVDISSYPCAHPLETPILIEKSADVLSVAPAGLNFGIVQACVLPEAQTVSVSNTSNVAVEITSVGVGAGYSVQPAAVASPLAPGESVQFQVQPDVGSGTVNSELKIAYDAMDLDCDKTLSIPLFTQFLDDGTDVRAATIEFPAKISCAAATRQNVTFSNFGSREAKVQGMRPNPNVQVLSTLPLTVPANGSATLALQFDPAQPVQEVAALQFELGACDKTLFVEYRGNNAAPSLNLPSVIDFGNPAICGRPDSTIKLMLRPAPLEAGDFSIENVSVSGPFDISLRQGDVISAGAQIPLSLRFIPTSEGEFSGFVDIRFAPCDQTHRIVLRGRMQSSGLAITPQVLDFGTLKPGEQRERAFTLRNTSDELRTIQDLRGVSVPFVIDPLLTLPLLLQPGEERTIRVSLRSVNEGELRDDIEVFVETLSNCGPQLELPLIAEVTERNELIVAVPELRFSADNSIVGLPIILRRLGPTSLPAGSFSISLRLNRRIFLVRGFRESDKSNLTIDGEDQLISLDYDMPAAAFEGDTLLWLEGRVMYDHDYTSSPIIIESFEWTGTQEFLSETEDGRLSVDGFCVDFGLKISPAGAFGIVDIRPNPVADGDLALSLSISSSEESVLSIFDNSGAKIHEQRWPAAGFGADKSRRVYFEHDLPQGVYHITLAAGTLRDYATLLVAP